MKFLKLMVNKKIIKVLGLVNICEDNYRYPSPLKEMNIVFFFTPDKVKIIAYYSGMKQISYINNQSLLNFVELEKREFRGLVIDRIISTLLTKTIKKAWSN